MPNDGIYLSNDTYQKFLGDTFEQDSRSTIADEWQRQATAAIPSMVADVQDRQQQAQRNSMADQFLASVPDIATQHDATPNASESLQNGPSAVPPAEPSQSATVAPDTAPAMGQAGVVDTSAPSPQTPAAPTVSPPATGYEASARSAAQKYGIDPDLFVRQIGQESGFNPNAQSPAGARGIAQFMPDTARGLGINPDDPEQALDGAARYMAQLIQHNGGDVSKALAAYNAGQGNVDKYGGIPPFEETKRYVANIMGGAGQIAASVGDAVANSGAGRVVTAAVNNVIGTLRPSQFGVGLSDGEAYAACGPVAAMAFARATGQNPTAEQAIALAKQVGWTPSQGMAGPGSELDLLKNMGVAAHMEQGADPAKIAQDVQNGNPVIISTPGHYFVADGYDPQKGFHVGSSGTDLKAGSEWMSLDQMQKVMGAAQATLYLDRKPGDGPSVASQMAQPTDQVAAAAAQPQSMWDKLGSGISDVFKNIFGAAAQMQAGQEAQTRGTTQAAEGLGGAVTSALAGAGGQMQTSLDLQRQGQTQIAEGVGTALTEPQPWMQNVVGAQTKQMRGEQLTPQEEYAQARGIATGLAQTVVPEDLVARAATAGAGSLARSGEVAQDVALSRQPAEATTGFASGFDALAAARSAVVDLQARFPQMSPGSLAASGAGRQLAEIEADAAAHPTLYAPPAGAPTLGAEVASTLPPGSGPLAPPAAPLGLEGWIAEAKARGIDTSAVEAKAPIALPDSTPPPLPPTTSSAPGPAATATGAAAPPVGPGGGTPIPPSGAIPPTPPTPPPAPVNVPLLPGPNTPKPVGFFEGLKAFHTGNVVSGLATLTHVTINSIKAPAWSFVTRGAADVVSGVSGALTGGRLGDVADLSGVRGSGIGVAAGLADSGRAIAQAISDHFANPEAVMNRVQNPALAAMFKVQGIPVSLHAAGMGFAQNIITKMEAGRLAAAEATRLGLSGSSWDAHVAAQIANPSGAIGDAAAGVAARASLRGELGTLGSTMNTVAKAPFIGNTLFPVVKIAANGLSQGIEMSPIGLLGTAWDVGRATIGKSGPYAGAGGFSPLTGAVAPLQERLTNNLAGTALTGWLLSKALDGTITGAGPSDPAKRAELSAQGWQANSVWVPGRGYVDYHALGTNAIPMALAGSYADAVNYGGQGNGQTADPEAIAGSMFEQMGKYLEDQTGMRQIGQLYDVFHPQGGGAAGTGQVFAKAGTTFASQLLGGFVPESALVRGLTSSADAVNRKPVPADLGQALSLGVPSIGPIPGRDTLPLKLDVLGRPEANPQAGLGVFMPRTGTGQPDPVFKVLEDAGVSIPPVPKTVPVSSKYSIAITPAEQEQYAMLRGQYLQQILTELNQTPGWFDTSPSQQKPILQRAFAQVDSAARKALTSQIPEADLEQRVLDNSGKKVATPLLAPGPLRLTVP